MGKIVRINILLHKRHHNILLRLKKFRELNCYGNSAIIRELLDKEFDRIKVLPEFKK